MPVPPLGHQWLKQPILGGINSYDSEDSLQPGQVTDSSNYLFMGQECRTRPGVIAAGTAVTNMTGRVFFAASYLNNKVTLILTEDGNVWEAGGVGAPTSVASVTGPAFGTLFQNPVSTDSVNGAVLFSTSNSAGMFRWVPGAGTYTRMNAASAYSFVAGHFSRAIGAFSNQAVTFAASNTFGWSATGDETNWTTLDSGSLVLNDSADFITGLGVINNVVVLLRYKGIHIATLTGTAPPAGPVYRAESFIRYGTGCAYPGTAAFYDNRCFFVGSDDVYTFDLQSVTPIGRNIKDRLLPVLNGLIEGNVPVNYYSFISLDTTIATQASAPSTAKPRFRYHLVPATGILGRFGLPVANLPHFMYDPQEDKWAVHNYLTPMAFGYDSLYPVLFDGASPSRFYQWDENLPQEAGAYLTGPDVTIEDSERNYLVERSMLRSRDNGKTEIAVTVGAVQDGTNSFVSTTDRQVVGTPEADGRWKRQYFNHRVRGQDFQWRIDVPPGIAHATNYLSLRYVPADEFKGSIPDQGPQGVTSQGVSGQGPNG